MGREERTIKLHDGFRDRGGGCCLCAYAEERARRVNERVERVRGGEAVDGALVVRRDVELQRAVDEELVLGEGDGAVQAGGADA